MSLLSTASPWINNDSNKKRIPSMRKTVKIRPYARDIISEEADEYDTKDSKIEGMATLDEVNNDNNDRSNRVNDIINQMSNISPDNDGQYLVDFKPPPMPEINIKKDLQPESDGKKADEPIDLPNNSLQIPVPMIPKGSNPYLYNNHYLSNYQTIYDQGIPNININTASKMVYESPSKMMEKINYMIHLLENQENEKTTNITEEFILYTFLGVFMIYLVDSFSRGGKYVR
jgi:hypothetical protein